MKYILPLALFFTVASTTALRSEDSPFINQSGPSAPASVQPGAPWREMPTALPPLPAEADLVEFKLDGATGPFRYFIDGRHLEIGPDKVIRYTLVAEASNGTRNLSREGIRCAPRGRYKVYAYGSEKGFIPVEEDWNIVASEATEPYRLELWRYHFCAPHAFMPRSKPEMIRSLRGQIPPGPNNGLLPD